MAWLNLFLAAIIFIPIVMTIIYVIRGWVLSILWGWFIVPFFGLPELSIPYAIGIATVIGLLTIGHTDSIKEEYKNSWGLWPMITTPFITLLVGWIVTGFI